MIAVAKVELRRVRPGALQLYAATPERLWMNRAYPVKPPPSVSAVPLAHYLTTSHRSSSLRIMAEGSPSSRRSFMNPVSHRIHRVARRRGAAVVDGGGACRRRVRPKMKLWSKKKEERLSLAHADSYY